MSTYFAEPTEASEKKIAHEPVSIENLYWVRLHAFSHMDTLRLTDEQLAIKEALLFKRSGGGTIVEMSNVGLSRGPLGLACKLSGIEVTKGWIEVGKWRGKMLDFFEKYDLLITPTTAVPAFPIGKKSKKLGYGFINWGFTPLTPLFNLTHNPAATVPCGFSSDSLPIGLQIVGRLEDDVTVLQASAAFEKVRPWADRRPPVS